MSDKGKDKKKKDNNKNLKKDIIRSEGEGFGVSGPLQPDVQEPPEEDLDEQLEEETDKDKS